MNESVKSAARVLDLLELFSVAAEPIGVSEASRLMAIPKSSAQALLATLVARGYLAKSIAGYEMSRIHKRHGWVGGLPARVRKFAEPVMSRLAVETGESAFLSVLTPSFEMKYIAKAISPHDVRYDAPLMKARPAYCMSSGLAVLAWLPGEDIDLFFDTVRLERKTPDTPTDEKAVRALLEKTRAQGYAELCDARVQGASGVSAPILDAAQQPIAAMTLVGPTTRFVRSRRMLRDRVVEAARELSERIAAPQRRAAS